jgi:hypothetical protein
MLAKQPEEVVEDIARRVEPGERLLLAEIEERMRATRAAITTTPTEPGSAGPRLCFTASPQEEPTKPRRTFTANNMDDFGPVERTLFLRQLEVFFAWLDGHPPDKIVAVLPAPKHEPTLKIMSAIITLLNTFRESLWQAGNLRPVRLATKQSKLAAEHRLPAVYRARFSAAEGGLVSYGPEFLDQYRSAAGYVDRILRGRNRLTCRCRRQPSTSW